MQDPSSPVGSVVRFRTQRALPSVIVSVEMLVLVVWSDAVGGLAKDRTPIVIRNTEIIDAQTVDPGPYGPPDPLVRTYFGRPSDRARNFQGESAILQSLGYAPAAQTVNEGSYSGGAILLALLLCVILIGFLILIIILMSKPDGSMTVTYRRVAQAPVVAAEATKTCPRCAETIKAAAVACRFCGYEYPAS